MKKIVSVLLALLACIVFSGAAHAASITSNLQVSATVGAVCSVSTTGVSFGNIVADGNWKYANGDVSVNCPLNTSYNIALNAGQNYDSVQRRVTDGQVNGASMYYRLFKDVQLQTNWGDANYANTYPGGTSLPDSGSGSIQPHTVYGRLQTIANGPSGSFTDNVVVTVHF